MSAANSALNTNTGSDIVAWVVVRHCHEPRYQTEEHVPALPLQGFHIARRDFARLRPNDPHPHPHPPPQDADHNAANWPHLDSACPSPRPLAAGVVL
jgi:hypothetical protein